MSNLLNIYFEADLADQVRGREFSILLIKDDGLRGMLTAINNSDRWVFHLYYDAVVEDASAFTPQRVTGILKRIIGVDGIEPRIISILPWQPTVKVADELQQGRVFLAGDAAHVMTPYGGKGANTGIQDVHNLAWKLAAVLQGHAGPELLATYNVERQPVGRRNSFVSGEYADEYGLLTRRFTMLAGLVWAVLLAKLKRLTGLARPDAPGTLPAAASVLGFPDYRYDVDGRGVDGKYQTTKALDGRPGTRAPHHWIMDQGMRISTLDRLGKKFVLFTSAESEYWKDAAERAGKALNLSIAVYRVPIEADALLIRPDGFVAWRWEKQTARPTAGLEEIMSRLLSRSF